MSTFGPTASRAGFRQVFTPLGASRKRKDRDAPDDPPAPPAAPSSSRPPVPKPKTETARPKPNPNPSGGGNNNRSALVLAGYLAHEFLTRGTLLGERLDPTAAARWEEQAAGAAACGDVTGSLVMGDDGARIPGIVNPTQLARWLRTKP